MNNLFYAKSILNVSLANQDASKNQYYITNQRNLVNKHKQPTKEFYDELDTVINHEVKASEAFDRALEIGRKQGFSDYDIDKFLRQYLKDKIPRTTLWRYRKRLESQFVPMEHFENLIVAWNQNGPTEQVQDPRIFKDCDNPEINRLMDLAMEEMRKIDEMALKVAKRLEELGCPKYRIAEKVIKLLAERAPFGIEDYDLHYVYDCLPEEYKDHRYRSRRRKVLATT